MESTGEFNRHLPEQEQDVVLVPEALPETPTKRITILSDTHDASMTPEKAKLMETLGGDINIAIGDVFDSKIRNEIITSFKDNSEQAVESLTPQEREIYDHLIQDGNFPLRAYWRAKTQANPELLKILSHCISF